MSSSRAASPQIDRTCLSPALQAGSLPLQPPGKMCQLKISHSKAKMELSPQQAKLEATGSVNVIRGSEHHSLCTPAPPHLTRLLRRKIEDFNPFSFKHYPLYLNLLHSHHPPNFFQQAVKVQTQKNIREEKNSPSSKHGYFPQTYADPYDSTLADYIPWTKEIQEWGECSKKGGGRLSRLQMHHCRWSYANQSLPQLWASTEDQRPFITVMRQSRLTCFQRD